MSQENKFLCNTSGKFKAQRNILKSSPPTNTSNPPHPSTALKTINNPPLPLNETITEISPLDETKTEISMFLQLETNFASGHCFLMQLAQSQQRKK